MRPPEIIEVAVQPLTKADQERMGVALDSLARDDPNFRVTTDHESGQTIIKGMSEFQLETLVDRVKCEFNVDVDVGAPQVAYRETLARAVEVDYTYKNQSGASWQFGRVKISVAPGERGSGVLFVDESKGGNIPREYIPSIEKGIREAAESGSLIGFPIIDFEIHLIDGAYHDIDSSPRAFEIAGGESMREAAQRAGIKLLEPIMKVEVVTPEDYVGDVTGDLLRRRGEIQSTEVRDGGELVVATAPLSNLFGLEKDLKTLTESNANVTMVWDSYAEVPPFGTDPDDTFPAAAALRA